MDINLHDVCKYYDASLKEHREAIDLLIKAIPKELLLDSAEWVLKFRSHKPEIKRASQDSLIVSRPILNQDIDWHNPNQMISKYFSVLEVTKGDVKRVPTNYGHIQNILTLAKELDKLRTEWGSAIGVTSWYRPIEVNRAVGGVDSSRHILGMAVDIYPYQGNGIEFERWLDAQWKGGLGYGQRSGRGFTHVDLDSYARWDY